MLRFVEEVDAVPKIEKHQSTVTFMMKQIHECALFIQQYGENGLFSEYCLMICSKDRRPDQLSVLDRAARGIVSTATDDCIKQFKQKFVELKENFDRGTIVDTFIVVHSIEQSVHQLKSTLEEINGSGPFSFALLFIC